jgi:hypothetical protein
LAWVKGVKNMANLNKAVQTCKEKGATEDQLNEIRATAMDVLASLGVVTDE